MPKGILEFDLSDCYEKNAHARASNATGAYIAFHEITNEIFRPARECEGIYRCSSITETLKKINELDESGHLGTKLIRLLEDHFHAILEDNNINMDHLE